MTESEFARCRNRIYRIRQHYRYFPSFDVLPLPDRPGFIRHAAEEGPEQGVKVWTQQAGFHLVGQLGNALAGRFTNGRVISLTKLPLNQSQESWNRCLEQGVQMRTQQAGIHLVGQLGNALAGRFTYGRVISLTELQVQISQK
jgi:hypothetical protein